MKKVALYIVIGVIIFVLAILSFIIALPSIIANSDRESQIRLNNYFEKVDYEFSGEIKKIYYLDGTRCLLEVEINEIKISKNTIDSKEDFVGIYNEKENIAIIFVHFPNELYDAATGDRLIDVLFINGHKTTLNTHGIFVRADSESKKIYFMQGENKDTTFIRPSTLYKKHLVQKENEMRNVIRF